MKHAHQYAHNTAARPFFVIVGDARHALSIVESYIDRGLGSPNIRDHAGNRYAPTDLRNLVGGPRIQSWQMPRWFLLTLHESDSLTRS
jgi:hypothetical protein